MEILLKRVLQTIPNYTMSVYKLPKTLCKGINSLFSNFWWGQPKNESKTTWMKWSKFGLAKRRGGLGYRDVEHFNMALLTKQGWRIMTGSLAAQVLNKKYFAKESFLTSRLGSNPSYVWRSIWGALKSYCNPGWFGRLGMVTRSTYGEIGGLIPLLQGEFKPSTNFRRRCESECLNRRLYIMVELWADTWDFLGWGRKTDLWDGWLLVR